MIKLFVSDVDGTLLDSTAALREPVRQAVLELRCSGVAFAIASGRSYNSIQPLIEALEGNIPVVCLNGAQIYDAQGSCLEQYFLPLEHIPALLSVASQLHCYTLCFCSTGNYLLLGWEESRRLLMEGLCSLCKIPDLKAEALCHKIMNGTGAKALPENVDIAAAGLLKIQFVFSTESQRRQALEMVSDLEGVQLAVTDQDLEITAEAATKGRATLALSKHLGFRADETAVIGDSANDRNMLSAFDCSFAMGNADRETLCAARSAVPANDENGAVEAIRYVMEYNTACKARSETV